MTENYKLNVERSPVDERDFVAETIFATDAQLPAVLDYRNQLMPVRDQGIQGTCAGQTAACMKEWQELKDVNFQEYMSPQFIYNNRVNQNSEGMYSRDVMKILNKTGSVPERMYRYGSFDPITQDLVDQAQRYRIQGYAAITTVDGLKKALYKNGPCYISVPVYNYGSRMWKPQQGDNKIGGHAMTVVGYNKKGFIIRNSWGFGWGDQGYTIFPYEDWGLQMEVWTTIDHESGEPFPDPSFFQRLVGFFTELWLRITT